MRKPIFLFACICFSAGTTTAQDYSESGSQSIFNYSPKEYNADLQNNAIDQDERGIIYFGNNQGLLEFDGNTWRLYPLPNKSGVRSLANGGDGKIYAGAKADLGYFLPDSTGKLTFCSLMNFVPKDKRDFADVWDAHVGNGKVYFDAGNYLLIWDIHKKEFKIIKSENGIHFTALINGKLYAREWGKGLEVLNDDSLVLVTRGEKFAKEKVYVMLPFPGEEGTSLIVTRTMGLFKYDGNDFIPFKTQADKFIKENLIYVGGTILSDGNILLGTLNGGAVVIDTAGKEVRRYNRENGIINNDINFTFQDRSGAIWLAINNGISRIDYSSPVTHFDLRNNISNTAADIIRHNGIIYSATTNGVYSLDPKTSMFNLLKNSNNLSWSFAEMGNDLLVGTLVGLFKVEKDKLTPIRKAIGNEFDVEVIKQSLSNPNRIYVATVSGLWSQLKSGNKWVDEGQILNNTDQPSSMVEDKDGKVWMGTFSSGLFRITFRKDDQGHIILNKPVIEHFDKANAIQNGYTHAAEINGVNYFNSADSTYILDENKKRFYADTSNKLISAFYKITGNKTFTVFQQDDLGRVWIGAKGRIAMGAVQPDGSWKWISSPFNSFADDQIYKAYAEKNGITWIAANSSIIKYDFGKKILGRTDYSALVRRVDIGKDSTIYFGGKLNDPVAPEIIFKNNSVKFGYSATSYEGKNINKFKTFLDGFDKGWSSYSTETTKEYTNLPPGKYIFKVAALNISEIESSTGTYAFEILPPWYRTWWAYSSYVVAVSLLAFAFIRLQRRWVIAKERQRAEIREAKLKADAENEQRKNIELISEMGKDITASLSIAHIMDTVYAHVNKLMDASVFGIGIYNRDKQRLEFPATREKGETLSAYSYDINDTTRPASWCFSNKSEVFINDFEKEHQAYISDIPEAEGDNSKSIMYLPLIYKDKSIGVITAQSFSKNAYNEYHLYVLRSLATYTAVALDNADAYQSLRAAQAQLIQSEKMASLGELTAGIAHEIQNPLNFVNNFSEVSNELIAEMVEEVDKGNTEEVKAIANDIKENLEKINHHGKRADAIVKGMLQHSQSSTGHKELTDINKLADEYLRLAYHGLRAKDKNLNAILKTDLDETIGKINIVPQDIGRVLLNLYNNAFYAVAEKQKQRAVPKMTPFELYEPTVSVRTKRSGNQVSVTVSDNGGGIPQKEIDKIFQPFFTTKPTGQGTGLGLSLSYDIIKAHGGEIKVETKEGEGSEFIIELPL